ncbi:DUF4214 domain-containing protein [Massilia forsythiae]|uniref:DUF4214 domain-containing protein n=1 Tax=Massilia forsythiae TaxID=2728020 RepID=A0A7Z2VU73_9BURK|nr:DUF4214 domain-containing protein [Massilia forsythiae]QJD99293.1 DUF4214 domain-containing protein [Massilia forsythiae]
MTSQTSDDSTVNSFYLAFYGRPADPAGLAFWSNQLQQANGDLTAISTAFSTSAEATARFGSEDAGARITDIYQQLFNRAPDAAGVAYWLDVMNNGKTSLANVAIAIMNGAQGSDGQLVELRKQAMDSFTTQVQSSGSSYSGYAAVEAARVLVRAVTLETGAKDMDMLVKAAVSFADTATKTPAVVDAIATGTTLLALFDTARGNADPAALAQTLADTAKAAAGNPATLDSLLRGGGMAKVLQVMPSDATLHDVVDALASGGLPAAVDVVYPSYYVNLAFKGVTQGEGDTRIDNVTNVANADVRFSYAGKTQGAQHFEYSTDGVHWISKGIVADTAGGVITIKGIDLTQGIAAGSGAPNLHIKTPVEGQPNLTTTVSLRAVDANGTTSASAEQKIVYDHYAATPHVVLINDTAGAQIGSDYDMVTRDSAYTLDGIEAGATVEFLVDTVTTPMIENTGPNQAAPQMQSLVIPGAKWSAAAPELKEGLNSFSVRQTDAAGNVSKISHVEITLDTKAPAAPVIALVKDSGIAGDGITSDGRVSIGGLDLDSASAWEYSVDGGKNWTFGAVNDGSGKAVLDLTAQGNGVKDVQVRQYDAAGNVGTASNHVGFTLDAAAPAFSLDIAFKGVTQGERDTVVDNVTNVGSVAVQFSYAGKDLGIGQHFEYSLDGVTWSTARLTVSAADHVVTIAGVDLTQGTPLGPKWWLKAPIETQPNLQTTVTLRAADDNGATTTPVSQKIVYDHYAAMPYVVLNNDTAGAALGSVYDMVTSDPGYTVSGVEDGAIVEYLAGDTRSESPKASAAWTREAPLLHEGLNDVAVRQTDAAGNVSFYYHNLITLDTHAPAAPVIAMLTDSGIAGDGITNVGMVSISGLDTTAATAWEYSIDGGKHWSFGDTVGNSGTATLDLSRAGDGHADIQVRQYDAAGNVGAASNTLGATLDTHAPLAPVFDHVQGAKATAPSVTDLSSAAVYFTYGAGLDAGDAFEYRVDGGKWASVTDGAWNGATHTLTIDGIDLGLSDHTVDVRVVDAAGNEGAVASQLIDSTANNVPEKSVVSSVDFDLGSGGIFMNTTPDNIIAAKGAGSQDGAANKATLVLQDMHTGVATVTAANYLDSSAFSVFQGGVHLSSAPALGLYRLGWSDDTFLTDGQSGKGYVAAGSTTFAGGVAGKTLVQGFVIGQTLKAAGGTVDQAGTSLNTAFIDDGQSTTQITSGHSMDLIADNGGTLRIVYNQFVKGAQDLILGFDSGNDKILLGGQAASLVDADGNGAISWAVADKSPYIVTADKEAVEVAVSGPLRISSFESDLGYDARTLNSVLDFGDIQQDHGVLILANDQDHGVLFYYNNMDDNGKIDAGELTVVNVFSGGVIHNADIQLVGVAALPPPSSTNG